MAGEIKSDCHLAPLMPKDGLLGGLCSFCGKECGYVHPAYITERLELTLRRWKENDMRTKDMLQELELEMSVAIGNCIEKVAPQLRKNKKPLYVYSIDRIDWIESPELLKNNGDTKYKFNDKYKED